METIIPRIKSKYNDEVVPKLMEQFQYKSIMQVPRLVKISVNQGIGAATSDKKLVDVAIEEMATITGGMTADDLLGEIFSRFCIGK